MSHTRFNLTECAKMAGVSRKTIQRKVSNGVLSASRDKNKKPYIELAELLRVYPNLSHQTRDKMSHGVPHQKMVTIPEQKLNDLTEQLARLEEKLNSITLLLENKREVETVYIAPSPQTVQVQEPEKPTMSSNDFDDLALDKYLDNL